jgi:two-component system alkaline phosphatase synthesis response regulator PhoP
MAKILIIEDEKPITELLEYNLKQNGYFVEIAHDGEEGLQKVLDVHPDLVILDLMLPKLDGMEICRRVKGNSNTQSIPIVMLTAKTEEVDRIVGLEMGADDYVTKPFSVRELILRIKAILKRADGGLTEVRKVEIKDLSILPDQHVVYVKGEEVILTHLEFNLLLALVNSNGRVLTRDTLLNKVWGYDYYGDTRTVDVHVRRLRQKLGAAADYVKTIRGTGYKFNSD